MPNRNTALSLYLAKIEGTEGTDAVPAPTTDAIELSESFEPDYDNVFKNEGENRVRGPVLDQGDPLSVAGKWMATGRKAFFRGSTGIPTTSNRIELDPWFQASGMAATYDATGGAEKVTYTPASSNLVTISEYYYRDGILYKILGVRGDVTVSFDTGGAIMVDFAAQGRTSSDADAAVPTTAVFKTTEWPIATDAPTFTMDGFTAGVIRHWEHTLGNTIQRRDGVKAPGGIQGTRIQRRNCQFKVTLEEDVHTTKDWTTLRDTKTPMAIAWTLNGVQYNRLDFSAARAYIRKITPSNDAGLALVTLEGVLRGATPFALAVK